MRVGRFSVRQVSIEVFPSCTEGEPDAAIAPESETERGAPPFSGVRESALSPALICVIQTATIANKIISFVFPFMQIDLL